MAAIRHSTKRSRRSTVIAALVVLAMLLLVIAAMVLLLARTDPADPGAADTNASQPQAEPLTADDERDDERDNGRNDERDETSASRDAGAARDAGDETRDVVRNDARDRAMQRAAEVEAATRGATAEGSGAPAQANSYVPDYRKAGAFEVAAGRSPIPQPGETLSEPLAFTRIVDPEQKVAAPGERISWAQAEQYIGQRIVAEGRVVTTNNVGSVCFVNFSDDWRRGFYVVVFKDCFDQFPAPPDKLLLNKVIQVSGEVTTHNGRAQIRVESADQVKIVQDKS